MAADEQPQNVPEKEMSKVNQTKRLSHKEWKKLRRKQRRKSEAKCRIIEEDEEPDSPGKYNTTIQEEKDRQFQHNLFLQRERLSQQLFIAKKERERKEQEYLEEQQKTIKAEWEELQKKDAEEREKREKDEKIEKERQDTLLKEATSNENKDAWHNPIAPVVYKSERPVNECPFFNKTGACKYGDSCSRTHDYPEESHTVVLPGMFNHFRMDQSLIDEYDTDLSLEYEDTDLHNSFLEFYDDVLPEFQSVGKVIQFKVCSNCTVHLRGNVYVSFDKLQDAEKAVIKFNGRWYAGKQINCEYRTIPKWKSAICGLFAQKSCPKGNVCNFLHVFKNPNNEFRDADFDFQNVRYNSERRSDYFQRNNHSYRWRRSRSRSRDSSRLGHRSRRRRSKSISRSRSSRYSRSRSNSRSRSKRYSRERSRSSSRTRSRRTKVRSRSKYSKDRSRSKSHSRNSRDKSRSTSRSRFSRDRSRSHSKSKLTKYSRERSNSRSKHSKKSKKAKKKKQSRSRLKKDKLSDSPSAENNTKSNIDDKINKLFASTKSEEINHVFVSISDNQDT